MLPDACRALEALDGEEFGPEVMVRSGRSGEPFLETEGVQLDSRYDPRREAGRRFERLRSDLDGREAVVLLGDGCAYLAERIAEETALPVVIIEAVSTIPAAVRKARGDAVLRRFSLLFTRDLVTPDDVTRLLPPPERTLFVTHSASEKLFGEEFRRVTGLVKASLRRGAANLGTVSWFGRRWLTNILGNMDIGKRFILRSETPGDVLIAVPGPTLPQALEAAGMRKRYFLIALAPALPWLQKVGLRPDLTVTSDGGFANLLHFCGQGAAPCPLVYPLMAYSGIPRTWPGPLVPVSTGLSLEDALLDNGAVPVFPESPTVSVFALQIAVSLGARRVFLAGQDFGQPGWRGHVPGYRFEEDLFNRCDRINTAERGLAVPFREQWEEEGGFRYSSTFRLYRDGFMESAAGMPVPVYALSAGPLVQNLAAGSARPETPLRLSTVVSSGGTASREGVSSLLERVDGILGSFPSDPGPFLHDTLLRGIMELLRPGACHLYREKGELPEAEIFLEGLREELLTVRSRLVRLQ